MRLTKILIAGVFCLTSFSANAEWTGAKKITYLKAEDSGIHFKLEGFVNNYEVTASCTDNFYMNKNTTDNYEAKVSFLLSAYMSDKQVNISFGNCDPSGHIAASSVAFN
ncbi:hypothetical protein [Microbulbifer epialgicus]|uniref:Uncharacterized protein n=1 Tax=Microbulbifer epialgicus TaxID=393907 RepID=A0ABV4P2M1_9GAMM